MFEALFNGAIVRIREGINDVLRGIADFFGSMVSAMAGAVSSGANYVINAVSSFFQQIGSVWETIKNAIMSNPAVQALMSVAQTTANTVGAVTSPVGGVVSTVGGALSGAGDFLSGALGAALPKFAGNIPNAAGGLIGAAMAESRAMPSGASLVVANSSETIIPRGASLSRPTSLSIGAININGVQDAGAIADQIINEIQSRFESAMNAQLS